jgi:hypothetical protein
MIYTKILTSKILFFNALFSFVSYSTYNTHLALEMRTPLLSLMQLGFFNYTVQLHCL